jgi:oligopeptide/dipeptide ABC transporter ATP-binding protein
MKLVNNGVRKMENKAEIILEVKDLRKWFPVKSGFISRDKKYVKAVDGVSFTLHKGETLGLVGESGCGKSTTGRAILRLIEPSSGQVILEGTDITTLSKEQMKAKRKDMQIVFQDPYSSLNPRMTIRKIIGEAIDIHKIASGKAKEEYIRQLLEEVGLGQHHLDRYPHQFSGGQRQRIGIARALAVHPKLMIMDEPVSALDVSIQAQVLNLLQDLQRNHGLTYIFITHNLSVVKHISDRIAVMYMGQIVEMAKKDQFFNNPQHPYSRALLSAIPIPNPELKRERILLHGEIASPIDLPKGCRFYSRCPEAQAICKEEEPALKDLGNGHKCACHLRR